MRPGRFDPPDMQVDPFDRWAELVLAGTDLPEGTPASGGDGCRRMPL